MINEVLIELGECNAAKIFWSIDDVKLKSSMILFSQVPFANNIFKAVIAQYFNEERDAETISRL